MSLIGIEIGELREMHKQLINKEISPKDCQLRLKVYKATADRERMILDLYKLSTLKGLSLGRLTKSGLFSEDELLSVNATMFDNEMVDCPDLGHPISREKCLDYSGESAHSMSCQTCVNFSGTRQKLLG